MITREQFLYLAGQLYDAQVGAAPSGSGDGRAPKFDTVLPAGDGLVIYASECSLKELRYQLGRAQKPPRDPKYTESNAKRAKALGYWVTYRESHPTAVWTGERNRATVTAAPPADKPAKYARDAAPEEKPFNPEPSAGSPDMDDIPFMPAERWG